MSGSISLSAMQMRQIDRYFRASMLNTFATISARSRHPVQTIHNAQYDLAFNNPKIKANSYPTTPEGKR
jgi:hypothetical protein